MDPETLILSRDERFDDVLWNLIVCNKNTAPFADLRDEVAVAAEDPQRDLERNVPNRLCRREPGGNVVIRANDGGNAPDCGDRAEPEEQDQRAGEPSLRFVTRVLV